MANNHTGNVQPSVDLEEHARIGNVDGKKVFVLDNEGNQITNFGSLATVTPVGLVTLAPSTNFIGLASVTGTFGGVFVSVASTWADGGTGIFRGNVNGMLLNDQGTLSAGEDLPNDVLKVEHQYDISRVTVVGTTIIKSSSGFLDGVFIGGVSNPTTIVYDNGAASGNQLAYFDPNFPTGFHPLHGRANTGITVNTTAGVAPKISVVSR